MLARCSVNTRTAFLVVSSERDIGDLRRVKIVIADRATSAGHGGEIKGASHCYKTGGGAPAVGMRVSKKKKGVSLSARRAAEEARDFARGTRFEYPRRPPLRLSTYGSPASRSADSLHVAGQLCDAGLDAGDARFDGW